MKNSWYFDEYGDEMIKKYKKDITEYQKKMSALPHEITDFETVLLDPKDYAEAVFAAHCFSFLKDSTDFLKIFDQKLQEAGEPIRTRNKLKYRFMDVSLGWSTESIIKHYITKLYEYRPDLGLQDELKEWASYELKRILQEPKTEAEVDLCHKYIECLAEKEAETTRQIEAKEEQEKRIQQYLERLQNRQDVYEKLKRARQTHSMLLDVLWNPTTEAELDFCISYFGFQDDIKFISEAAKEGRIKPVDLTTVSDAVFYGDWYFEQPINQAKILYDLTILEQTNYQGLMTALQEKGNFSSLPIAEYQAFKDYLDALIISGISREEIAKGNSSEVLTRFNSFAQKLHQRYLANMNYEDEDTSVARKTTSTVKTREDEVREYAEQRGYQYIKAFIE